MYTQLHVRSQDYEREREKTDKVNERNIFSR